MSLLPVTARVRPVLRLLVKTWDPTTANWSAWNAQLMAQRINAKKWTNGFILTPWSRKALPDFGTTTLIWYSGSINGRDQIDGPDLKAAQVRIQSAAGPEVGAEATWTEPTTWTDEWWGVVQMTEMDRRANRKNYYCIDLLADYAQRTQIICHNAEKAPAAIGHPGFNIAINGALGRVLGNRDASTPGYDPLGDLGGRNTNVYHTFPGSEQAVAWTDLWTIGSLLQVNRRKGDPIFTVDDKPEVFSNLSLKHAWDVPTGVTLWAMLNRICDRRRGRGVCFFDWDGPTGTLAEPTPILRVLPQTKNDVIFGNYNGVPLGSAYGATHFEPPTTLALDYQLDQRLSTGPVIAQRSQYSYDYVETRGEPIQVLVTLSYADGSLAPRWTTADAIAFNALTSSYHRSSTRWDPVYQRHGLPLSWDWIAGDGLGANKSAINYRCEDTDSKISLPGHYWGIPGGVSFLTARILPDLCLYEGYDYSTGVLGGVRYDGATDTFSPPRLPPLILRKASGSTFYDLTRLGFSLQIDEQWGIYLRYGPNGADTDGGRYFGKTTSPATPNVVDDYTNLLGTFTLEINQRVRTASGNANGGRRLTIDVPGAHLWLAHPQAIWKLNRESVATVEAAPLRGPGAPGRDSDTTDVRLLRDDRPWLRIVHAMACQWYLQDHTPVTFSQRGLPSLTIKDAAGATITQPRLGYFLTTLTTTTRTGSVTDTVNCPITSITYDPARDQADIVADWNDLDFTA